MNWFLYDKELRHERVKLGFIWGDKVVFIEKIVYIIILLYMWCVARFGTNVQFKKREKHPWRSANFSKVVG